MAEPIEPTAESLKQKKKRAKKAAEDAANKTEKIQVEVAGGFKAGIKKLMRDHGFNNQQEIHQNLLRNVLAADFETQARMLKCITTPFEITPEVSRDFTLQSLREIRKDPGDEVIQPHPI
ncbi:MAG: hypothetical protein JWP42_4343 [Pseudomonas sp.]|nr:hypothetical protein [Pseudomonas sp.]